MGTFLRPCGGLVEAPDRQFRFAVLLFEGRRFNRYMARHAFELKGLYYALGRLDLAIHAPESVVVPVRPAFDEAPRASGAEIHIAGDHRHGSRPHQRVTCSGFEMASKTSLRGASKTRVMTISETEKNGGDNRRAVPSRR